MATKVNMPKQGLQMTEGTIISWLAAEGEQVKEGYPLYEMETDKLTIEISAPASGTLLKIIRGEGDVVPITETIAIIGEQGEDISGLLAEIQSSGTGDNSEETAPAESQKAGVGDKTAAASEAAAAGEPKAEGLGTGTTAGSPAGKGPFYSSPRARWKAEEYGIDITTLSGTGPEGMVVERDVQAAAQNRPKATPLAQQSAAESGIDLSGVEGSGPRGKIYRKDVEAAHRAVSGTAAAGTAARSYREDRLVPLTGMRKTISARMRESLDTAAQAVHRIDVDMSETVRMRESLKAAEVKVSYNDIILKAVSLSLQAYPRMNSRLTDDGILELGAVNIGVAVALDEGLIVPVLRDVDLLSLKAIHDETRRLADRARTGELTQEEYTGGSFSVSNLGMYELDSFTAIINRPESGILAVGAIKDKPAAVKGELQIRPICGLSLTYDHRIIDGAPAADFLLSVKQLLENPYLLV
ncbi:MAG: 2-oxo acid dehydrogenase subunit E2 [Spirochaetia bacterium]|nr:2-oxo acid dehydrogenase subunit E2 [Spirochaetia bacterium]